MGHGDFRGKDWVQRLLVCRVGAKVCGLPLDRVVETMRPLPAEPLAQMASFVTSLALIRGRPAPIVDARKLLGSRSEGRPGRYVTLGELVAGVAHELNNPLAFALSHLDTARAGLTRLEPAMPDEGHAKQWQKVRDRLTESVGGLERIRSLVLKLRTFSRLDEGERKVASVPECVDSVLMILAHRTRGRIEVEATFDAPLVLDCFPSLLNQAVMNLIANAIDAVEESSEAPRVVIHGGADDAVYVLRITDNGPGVPEALLDRVFEPFFTTKEVGKGTGLGLSITYSIIEKHGGTLELLPAPGRGTIAEIRLPLIRRSDRRGGSASGESS